MLAHQRREPTLGYVALDRPGAGGRRPRRRRAVSREIADKLYLSHRTVENHLQRIYDKLGVSNRHQLAAVLKR